MADFMYLFRGGEIASQLPPAALQASMQKWGAWMKELGATGNFKSGEPLENGGMRVVGKKKTVVDGPHAEAKDVVGGFVIVQAKDIREATELAKGCPIFEYDGEVEVRPVRSMNL